MDSPINPVNPSATEKSPQLDEEILASYSQRLIKLAAERLVTDIQSKISPEDIVQSTLRSYFRRSKEFGWETSDPDRIWELLSVITIRKCRKWDVFYHCSKRDVRREVRSLDESRASARLADAKVSPDQEDGQIASELLEYLLSHFTQRQQEMILLRIQGLSVEMIARQCHSSHRTVARTIAKSKQVLHGL